MSSKVTKSSSNTNTSTTASAYDGLSDEASHTSSNDEEVPPVNTPPRPAKSKKLQPRDATEFDEPAYDRQCRKKFRKAAKPKRKCKSRSRSRRRR